MGAVPGVGARERVAGGAPRPPVCCRIAAPQGGSTPRLEAGRARRACRAVSQVKAPAASKDAKALRRGQQAAEELEGASDSGPASSSDEEGEAYERRPRTAAAQVGARAGTEPEGAALALCKRICLRGRPPPCAPPCQGKKGGLARRACGGAGGGRGGSRAEAARRTRPASPTLRLQAEKERKPAGLPVKTLEGEVVLQRAGGSGSAARSAGDHGRGGGGTGSEALGPAAVPAARIQVAGVTIQDDLAEHLEREQQRAAAAAEAERAAAERAAREAGAKARAAQKGERRSSCSCCAQASAQARQGLRAGCDRHPLPAHPLCPAGGAAGGEKGDGGVMAELAAYADAQERCEAAKRAMAAAAQALLQVGAAAAGRSWAPCRRGPAAAWSRCLWL